MNLTPVKGRGKGPRKVGFRPPDPKRRKLVDEDGEVVDSVYKRGSAAPIEKLPTEVLYRILLFSREYNFPKASLRVGKVLSHPSFYTELVLQAFEPTWDMWMGCRKSQVHSYHGWFEDKQRFGGDPELQSKVLGLPFITLDTVMDAQQMWLRKYYDGRHYQHGADYNASDYDEFDEWSDDEREGLNEGATSDDGVPHGVRGYDHMKSAAACFEEEWVSSCFNPNHFHASVLGGGLASRLEVHPFIRIPDRLITGPWEEKDVKLLFWLVHNNAIFAEDQSWEMTLQGVQNLFMQDNAEIANIVTTLLYAAGGFKELPEGVEPVSIDTAFRKLVRHRQGGQPCHRDCTWRSVVDRLFDLVDMSEDLSNTAFDRYNFPFYDKVESPWREGDKLIAWQR